MSSQDEPYQPKDAINEAATGLAVVGGAGVAIAAVENALTKQNIGAMGIVTKFGGTAAMFAALGVSYTFVTAASANLRAKNDSWNPAIGGFVGGAVTGLRSRRIPVVLGLGAALAVLMGGFDYAGGSIKGNRRDPNADEFERLQAIRANKRRPIEETISDIGEGRGIHPPGYDERRRQRLKERYGIDVPTKQSS